eukprot:gnl/TRDRNA2_/TRDRNA2_153776_c0_seq1.p1 gnl/TRDRNA2_/TRDRNA2_153776_c0~~gnl/TRDRNA2_/TRDRNA2_153776_c0_seq1.p1  ORF type:complete len:452 (+),score=68.42 gnl/TRDRNA2_/TRDRNA2_153776_c0_seq1:59-1414(+)
MSDFAHEYHRIERNGESDRPGSSGRWLKLASAVAGASCLVLFGIFAALTSEATDATADDRSLAMDLYSRGLHQFRHGSFAGNLPALPSSLGSGPGPLQSQPGAQESQHGHRWSQSQHTGGAFRSQPAPATSWSPGPRSRLVPLQASAEDELRFKGLEGRTVVVGAGGKTGRLVLEKLLGAGRRVTGLVRTQEKADQLSESMSNTLIMPGESDAPVSPQTCAESVSVADIMDASSLAAPFAGASTIIVCSSATPQLKKRSLIPFLWKRLISFGKEGRPSFRFPPDGTPEEVDYQGMKNIIEAAKTAGIKRVVLVGSMGGTQKENFLNTIGEGKDGSQGNILVWKRKAEIELINSGLEYTIIHPGGLLDKEGGKREIVVGVDDELLNTTLRRVPRADVAAMAVTCIDCPAAKNCAFDMASKDEDDAWVPTKDLCALVGSLGSKTCDYSINVPP